MVPKFQKDGRSSNGVAAVLKTLPDGTEVEEGIRLNPYFYSGKEIASIGKWEKLVKVELRRVRDLPNGKVGGWVKDTRPKGRVWEEDPLSFLPGVGKVAVGALEKQGIKQVKDLLAMDEVQLDMVVAAAGSRAVTKKKIEKWRKYGVDFATPGRCRDTIVDYRTCENPYKARYGDNWEERIKKSQTLSKFCCVKDLVLHIDRESREAFQGTKHEEDYVFYHDALTQMTDIKCTNWMKEEGLYHRWIKPELGCNNEVEEEKNGQMVKRRCYKGRPTGNSPELNPLDNSCFRDFRTNLSLNVAATWHLERDDKRKFSLSTPREIDRAVVRLWNRETGTSPSSVRILQDIKRIPDACYKIVEYEGKIVPGLADRNGHRREKNPAGIKRDAVLYKDDKTLDQVGIHHSIRDLVEERHKEEKVKFEKELGERTLLTEASIQTT